MSDPPWFVEAKKKYLDSLDEKGSRLEELLEAYRGDPSNEEAREELRGAFHRIHGSAGSYGLSDLGQICGRCEEQLIQLRAVSAPSDSDLQSLGDAIREFRSLARAVQSDA